MSETFRRAAHKNGFVTILEQEKRYHYIDKLFRETSIAYQFNLHYYIQQRLLEKQNTHTSFFLCALIMPETKLTSEVLVSAAHVRPNRGESDFHLLQRISHLHLDRKRIQEIEDIKGEQVLACNYYKNKI